MYILNYCQSRTLNSLPIYNLHSSTSKTRAPCSLKIDHLPFYSILFPQRPFQSCESVTSTFFFTTGTPNTFVVVVVLATCLNSVLEILPCPPVTRYWLPDSSGCSSSSPLEYVHSSVTSSRTLTSSSYKGGGGLSELHSRHLVLPPGLSTRLTTGCSPAASSNVVFPTTAASNLHYSVSSPLSQTAYSLAAILASFILSCPNPGYHTSLRGRTRLYHISSSCFTVSSSTPLPFRTA
jgi:hypothetical protein